MNVLRRPKRRHLVISEFVRACLDEETLLDEDGRWRSTIRLTLELKQPLYRIRTLDYVPQLLQFLWVVGLLLIGKLLTE